MPLNEIVWQKGSPPKDETGQYLVWLGGRYAADRQLSVYTVRRCINGFLYIINDHFDYEYLDDECYIVAWASAPEGPDASLLG